MTVANEQYSRRANIKVLGVPKGDKRKDCRKKMIELFESKLDIKLRERDIEVGSSSR